MSAPVNGNGNGRFRLGDCVIEPGRNRIWRGDDEFAAHPREMDLLEFLIGKEGSVASIGEIVDTVWKGTVVTDHSVYYAIHQLRAALDAPDAERSLIETIPRKGYRLTARPEPIVEPDVVASPEVSRAPHRSVSVRASAGMLFLFYVLGIGVPPAEVSIAVLTFKDLGIEPDNQYLVEAVPSDLTTGLSRICNARIASRTSTRAVEAAGYDVPTLARRLSVRYVLEGGVQQSENHLRISPRLIETGSDKLVWADEFRRELTTPDLFFVQENIVREIARKLEASFCPQPASPAPRMATANREAYRLLQLGKQRFDRQVTPAVIESVSYFKRAIELDPNYAEAYARLARAYRYWGFLRSRPPPGISWDDVRGLLDRALELDEGLGLAHAEIAHIFEDEEQRIAEVERALELEPGNVEVYEAAFLLGDPERELQLYLHALEEIDPLAPDILRKTAKLYYEKGQSELGNEYFHRAVESEALYVEGYFNLGNVAWGEGRLDEAMKLLRTAHETDPAFVRPLLTIAWVYLDIGDDAEAERWLDRRDQMLPDDDGSAWGRQWVYHKRGDHQREFELYDAGVARNPRFAWYFRATHFVADGRLEEARELFRTYDPDLLTGYDGVDNLADWQAFRLSVVVILLDRLGEADKTRAIWRKLESYYEANRRRLLFKGLDIEPILGAAIYAYQGKAEQALRELQAAVDSGWRRKWWLIESEPDYDPIRGDPRFQTILEQLRTDAARQLANVRAMEASGEIRPMQPLPELDASRSEVHR